MAVMKMHSNLIQSDNPETKRLAAGAMVRAPFRTHFRNDDWTIEIKCDVIDGQTDIVEYSVARTDGAGIKAHSTEVARGVNLRHLLSYAFVEAAQDYAAWSFNGTQAEFEEFSRGEMVDLGVLQAVVDDVRRTPAESREEDIQRIAAQHNSMKGDGSWRSWEALAEDVELPVRTVYRRAKEARNRGLLDGEQGSD